MNPDGDCWMIPCLGLDDELTDVERVGLGIEISQD